MTSARTPSAATGPTGAVPTATKPTHATCVIACPNVAAALPFGELFDATRPLEVDVGCGKGRFLLARAAAHPGVQFLGVDRMLPRIRKLDRKVQRARLGNVRLLRLEASYTLRHLLPPHCVRTFYIFFPDPWPKRRHHKRRLFSEAFLGVLWSRLVPGGEVQFATDHLDYFEATRRSLARDPRFEEVPALERTPAEQTDFELIFRGQGLPIGACGFRARPASEIPADVLARLQAADAARAALEEEDDDAGDDDADAVSDDQDAGCHGRA